VPEKPLGVPLKTHCHFSETDFRCLSRCLSFCQQKHLNLRGVRLTYVCPEPLQVLLRVAATLKTLDLEDCGTRDSQLSARPSDLLLLAYHAQLLWEPHFHVCLEEPSALHCQLSQLSLELYSAPLDSSGAVLTGRFAQKCAKLRDTLKALRQPRWSCSVLTPYSQFGNLCILTWDLVCVIGCLPSWVQI
jgi:hypothetical protein